MRKTILFSVFACAMLVLLPFNVSASGLVFEGEYQNETQHVFIDNGSNTTAEMDLFDIYKHNNWNDTIYPLQQENDSFKGIVQYGTYLPSIWRLENATAQTPGYTYQMAWKYIPDDRLIFDTIGEMWLRLPVNNITLGSGNGEISRIGLSIYRLYGDEYNVSLSDTWNDYSIVGGPHGDTPNDIVYNNENFTETGYTNHIKQDNRSVSWNATKNDVTTEYNVDYNFTYLKLSCALQKQNPYIFFLQLYKNEPVNPQPIEVLVTNADNNNDRLLLSHLYYTQQANITIDLDVPVIVTSVCSGETNGLGFFNTTGKVTILNNVSVTPRDVTTNHYITIQIPIYSLTNTSISLDVEWGSQSSPPDSFNLTPGYNIITFTNQSTSIMYVTGYTVKIEINNGSSVALLTNALRNNSGLLTATDKTNNKILHHSFYNIAGAYMISTSHVAYTPLSQYAVYVVPDPTNYEDSKTYIDYADQFAHLSQDYLWLWEDEEGEEGSLLLGALAIGIMVLGVALVVITAPIIAGAVFVGALLLFFASNPDAIEILKGWGEKAYDLLIPEWLKAIIDISFNIGSFVDQVLEFVVNGLSWLVSNAIHFLALWVIISVFLLSTIATGGLCNAVTTGRRKRGKNEVLNMQIFEDMVADTSKKYIRLLTLNMAIISAILGLLMGIIQTISPF